MNLLTSTASIKISSLLLQSRGVLGGVLSGIILMLPSSSKKTPCLSVQPFTDSFLCLFAFVSPTFHVNFVKCLYVSVCTATVK